MWLELVAALETVAFAAAPTIDLKLTASSLSNVTCIANAHDGSGRLFVTEKAGVVKVLNATGGVATAFLDIRPLVLTDANERGLLGLAFHPGYATNGMFYVYFTALDTSNMVARFNASPASASSVNTNTMATVIRLPHPGQSNHNGGDLQFGPDGYLYLAPGDGGSGCDPPNNAQSLSSPLGKLLRIDVNNFATNYTIPPSNPFIATAGARPEIWAYGLRNPWRFSFDRLTGDLFIGDVGQGAREEVDFQAAGSAGGQNYGWRLYEGLLTNTCSVTFSNIPTVLPILDYDHTSGRCSITGGYRYRGAAIPPLVGAYLYGDYCGGQIYGATPSLAGVWSSVLLTDTVFAVTTFGEDEAGELYVSRYANNVNGGIYRIIWKDSDSDGMPDDYETANGFNPTNAADAAPDADGDGQSNLAEFLAGTDPRNAASVLRVKATGPNGADWTVTFDTMTNKLYRVERTDDLATGSWTNLTGNLVGTGNAIIITDTNAAAVPQRFYRVHLLP